MQLMKTKASSVIECVLDTQEVRDSSSLRPTTSPLVSSVRKQSLPTDPLRFEGSISRILAKLWQAILRRVKWDARRVMTLKAHERGALRNPAFHFYAGVGGHGDPQGPGSSMPRLRSEVPGAGSTPARQQSDITPRNAAVSPSIRRGRGGALLLGRLLEGA